MAERVYCLYRVSTNKQVDHDENNQADIPMQRKACHDFAAKMGWVIVGEEQETGVSGYKVSADDRDKLQLIKKYAEQGKFDILLVFMFDRLGRKSDETPFVVEWFTKKGVRVWSVQEGEQRFESHTDRLTNYIRFWQADGESQKTSMRTKTALGQMVPVIILFSIILIRPFICRWVNEKTQSIRGKYEVFKVHRDYPHYYYPSVREGLQGCRRSYFLPYCWQRKIVESALHDGALPHFCSLRSWR